MYLNYSKFVSLQTLAWLACARYYNWQRGSNYGGNGSDPIKYYDSLFKDISVQTVQTIVSLLKPWKSISVKIMDVLPQKGAADDSCQVSHCDTHHARRSATDLNHYNALSFSSAMNMQ